MPTLSALHWSMIRSCLLKALLLVQPYRRRDRGDLERPKRGEELAKNPRTTTGSAVARLLFQGQNPGRWRNLPAVAGGVSQTRHTTVECQLRPLRHPRCFAKGRTRLRIQRNQQSRAPARHSRSSTGRLFSGPNRPARGNRVAGEKASAPKPARPVVTRWRGI